MVVPVYIFLTLYFVLAMGLKYFSGINLGITSEHIIGSYTLMGGIGYVWIIRVFLLIALLTPFLMKIEQRLGDLALIIFITVLSLLLTLAVDLGIGINNVFVNTMLYYAVGYSVPFIVGLRIMRTDITHFKRLLLLVATIMVLFCVIRTTQTGITSLLNIQGSKYPPQAYFLFYGLLMSLVCYAICFYTKIGKYTNAICRFIGSNTIWIYLYHIPLVQITKILSLHWSLRYVISYVLAVAICYVQVYIIEKLRKYNDRKIYKYLQG